MTCRRPPRGWFCTRPRWHGGPCAAWPRWWNLWAYPRLPREILVPMLQVWAIVLSFVFTSVIEAYLVWRVVHG